MCKLCGFVCSKLTEGSRNVLAVQISTASAKIQLAGDSFLLLCRHTLQKGCWCPKSLELAMVMDRPCVSCLIGNELLNPV